MKILLKNFLIVVIHGILLTTSAQHIDECSEEKSSSFLNYFAFHDPMFFTIGEDKKEEVKKLKVEMEEKIKKMGREN